MNAGTLNHADRPRILVADDDLDILELVAAVLHRAGYEVVTVADGLSALELARADPPDLLLLDVSMPRADGYTVCEEIQRAGPTAPPVIFLTARGQSSDRVAGLDLGAVDYVVKPFDRAELLARVRAALRTKAVRDSLAAEATTDPLTGLLNRGQLYARAAEVVSLARRYGQPLACLMIDLDGFKQVNDTFGHAAGDLVLAEAARRLGAVTRMSDVIVRYGGEEFLLLLPGTDADGAVVIGERIRSALADEPVRLAPPGENGDAEAWNGAGAAEIEIRASVGAACWHPRMAGPAALFAAADEALYRAKQRGRDCVELARADV